MVKDAGLNERFIEACIVGNQKRASAALAAGAEITYRSQKTGVTGFQCAARGGHQALAKHLLTLGSEVDSRDRDGCTALFDLVSEDNDVATATFLLDQGADVDAANNDGWTPLMVACTWDERWNDVVAMLIKRGANVNHIARDDWTPLMLAFNTNARNGPHTVLLAAKGLDLELVTPQYGWTPLLNAAAGTNLEAVRMLLERGANVHARMKVAAGKPFVAKTSLRARNRAGAIKAKPEHDGFTPLHWAKLKNRRCQPLLIKAGADLNAKSGSGKTATDLRVPPPAPQRASPGGHEHALLAAIAAAPDQDAPRLVYADWLLEQGNAWGEVIVASLRKPVDEDALAKLEKKHAAAFLKPIAPFVRVPRFERGLLASLVCDAQLFPKAAEAIAQRAPGATVKLTGLKPKGVAQLLTAPLGRFGCLVLDENRVDDEILHTLAASPALEGLKALALASNPFTERGVTALTESPHLAELSTLDLDHAYPTPLSKESLTQVVTSPRLRGLTTLTFSCAGPGLGRALAACTVPLRTLTLHDVDQFSDADAVAIVEAKELSKLETLTLFTTHRRKTLGLTRAGVTMLRTRLKHLVIDDVARLA